MGKKMKVFSLFKTTGARSPAWPWPSCSEPRTLSFRTTYNDSFMALNSLSSESTIVGGETPDSFFTGSFSAASDEGDGDQIESVTQGLRAERLFFKLGKTRSILEEAKNDDEEELVFRESMVLAMDSRDPYLDFRKSMEEMVEAHGLRRWKGLEELLRWYLKLNGESSRRFILEAFADLLVSLAFSSSSSSPSSCSFCRHCRRLVSSSSGSYATNGRLSSPQIVQINTSSSALL